MKDIHIYAIDPQISNINEFLKQILYQYFPYPHKFNFIWDEINPDYIFIRPFIYFHKKLFKKFKKYYSNNRIIIYFGSEMIFSDLNIFDYSVVYDSRSKSDDRICQFPYITYFFGNNSDFLKHSPSMKEAEELLSNKTGFCNFIYSNGYVHPFRDKSYYALSEYKSVDSLGTHLHNKDIAEESGRSRTNWLQESINLKENYKFSIAIENTVSPGYVTEKIMSSFSANTIPIYFGDPDICQWFNPESFINCNEYDSIDAIVERVREIDNSNLEYLKMLTAPRQTTKQAENYAKVWDNYVLFINNIFEQDISKSKRKPEGSSADSYSRSYFRNLEGKMRWRFKEYVLHPTKYPYAINELLKCLHIRQK